MTEVKLPLSASERESLEGTCIRIKGPLVATDVYQFGKGNFTLSGNGLQYVPTEVMMPGPETISLLESNKAYALPVYMSESMAGSKLLTSGTPVDQIMGIVAHDGRRIRVSLTSISTNPGASFTPPRAATHDSLRIVGMNLHNYFNGDGRGLGFPTPRGAETIEDFMHQRERIGAAVKVLNPHVIAVMELENDGFGADSAAQDFIQLTNNATDSNWMATQPAGGNTGTDRITVGMFYRSDRLAAIGPAQTLTGPEFEYSRQPQAQLFRQLPHGGKVLIVINHLKSKGSCPDSGKNADQKDGQGCWNPMREASAIKMTTWAKDLATSGGTDNILILGDMNAYRNEDPIEAIRKAGFKELVEENPGKQQSGNGRQQHHHSFVYYGQHGTLDYAFSSTALFVKVQQAFIWNVNASFPANMDKDLPRPWLRFSDHDPVVVDLSLRQSSTSN
ncbi:MAG: ExeM/NucH family extracellular endonuclease [Gammaproteobacteria bacterium]|nr:ExeM/NucH family extracellular endonuclease [Gammaproteobacteria bacterium]